jgi:8-oxo-dGTP pyrophosphatase MutT (NUDIX family)
MDTIVPVGARAAARILVLSDQDRVLLLEAEDSPGGPGWWVAPGGGLRADETFEAAARRELHEETGLLLPIGRWVWTRRHIFVSAGRRHDQYERYFVARTAETSIRPVRADSYVIGHRWWGLDELEGSDQEFAPRRLASLLPPILRGEYPDPAIDCGV